MRFDFAKVKARVRKVVHDTLSVSAHYSDDVVTNAVCIRARWHSKLELQGDLNYQGYAEVLEGIDRIIFNITDARHLNIKRGGLITFTAYSQQLPDGGYSAAPTFLLDSKEPTSGPHEEIWRVTRP